MEQRVFTGGLSGKEFGYENRESVDPADPGVVVACWDAMPGQGDSVVTRGGWGDNRVVVVAGFILGVPLADEPCVDVLGGTRGGIVVEASREQEEGSEE